MALQGRSKGEVERFFTGLDLVEPGIQVPHRRRPHGDDAAARIGSAEWKDTDAPDGSGWP
jgi:hypothetical protein